MATHQPHHIHPNYDERQILHDGCDECKARGKDLALALANMSDGTFERAWRRAYDLNAGDRNAVGSVAENEKQLLRVLWGLMVFFERHGFPLNGLVPSPLVLHQ